MKRRPTTQDITWLLDLERNKQLDLDPPYQRRSVWTKNDREFFLDTIFRDYPSPAIFLHKSISSDGKVKYHVVDGKQRLQTILDFTHGDLRISKDFGDKRLNGKKWSDLLEGDNKLKQQFWNYEVTVEMVGNIDGALINEVFDRLNRNSRKLTRQELRHAKFDGWFAEKAEKESEEDVWETLGVVTVARAKRMADTQFIAELMLVILEKKVLGFDQDKLDALYADYDDDPSDSELNISETQFKKKMAATKAYLVKLEELSNVVSTFAGSFTHFYTLWCVVALNLTAMKQKKVSDIGSRYSTFMKNVQTLAAAKDLENFLKSDKKGQFATALAYYNQTRGASTDLAARQERYDILKQELLG
jgi:hypothetical protein